MTSWQASALLGQKCREFNLHNHTECFPHSPPRGARRGPLFLSLSRGSALRGPYFFVAPKKYGEKSASRALMKRARGTRPSQATCVRIHPNFYLSWPPPPTILRFFRGPRAACRVGRGEIGTRVEKTRLRVLSYRGPHFDEKPAEVWPVLNARGAAETRWRLLCRGCFGG